MRHNLAIEGPAFRLRPVRIYDAAFVAGLRADPEWRRGWNRGAAGAASAQQRVLTYFDREGDYFLIIENRATGIREGAAGIYSLDLPARKAEWGHWILRRSPAAALESACLLYRLGFEALGLDSMFCKASQPEAIQPWLTRTRWEAIREAMEEKAGWRRSAARHPAIASQAAGA